MSNYFGQLHDSTSSYPKQHNQAVVAVECLALEGHLPKKKYAQKNKTYNMKESLDFIEGDVLVTDASTDTHYEPLLSVYNNVGNLPLIYDQDVPEDDRPKWKFVGIAGQKSVLESHKKEILQVYTSGLVAVVLRPFNKAEMVDNPFQHGDEVHVRFPTQEESLKSTRLRLCKKPPAINLNLFDLFQTEDTTLKDKDIPKIGNFSLNSYGVTSSHLQSVELPFNPIANLCLEKILRQPEKMVELKQVTINTINRYLVRELQQTTPEWLKNFLKAIDQFIRENNIAKNESSRRTIFTKFSPGIYKICKEYFVLPSIVKLNLRRLEKKEGIEHFDSNTKQTLANNILLAHWLMIVGFNQIFYECTVEAAKGQANALWLQSNYTESYEAMSISLFQFTVQNFEKTLQNYNSKYCPCIGICRSPPNSSSNGYMMVQLAR